MARAKRPVPAHRRDLQWAGALTAVALIHRLLFLHAGYDTGWAFSLFYEGDAEPFFRYARAILEGRPYDGGVPFHPPGFPYLLAAIHALTGAGEAGARVSGTAVRAVMALVGASSVGLTYLFVKPYLGRTVAVIGAAAWAYAFAGYVVATTPVSEALYQVVLFAALLVWSRKLPHPLAAPGERSFRASTRWAVGLGLLLALLALVRAEGLLAAALLLGAGLLPAAVRPHEHRAALVAWGVAGVAFILGLVPWTVRNHLALSRINHVMQSRIAEPLPTLVPLTAYGPLNLALANNPGASGIFSRELLPDPSGRGVLDLTNSDHLEVFLRGDAMAWRWIRERPGDFIELVAHRWTLAFGALRLGWTQWDLPGGLTGLRRPVDCFVPASPWGARALGVLCLAGAGLLLLRRRRSGGRRYLGALGLVVLVPVVATGLFFGYARLVVVVLPLVYALAAVPLARAVERVGARWRDPRAGAYAAAVLAAGLLAVEIAGSWDGDRTFEVRGTVLEGRGVLNPDETVAIAPVPSGAAGR